MSRFFVSINHLSDAQLEFYGWYLVRENEEFKVYGRPYDGEEQIVSRDRPFLAVDDYNDALYMKAETMIEVPAASY
ncbi:MAG: hypothetical protein EOR36_24770 [Mesorhizobium sp.]|uniref:hypothetical protein n=1 Tax=Mesorhizobium sp. TaxID=1871066 RepID=UPI000FE6872A|nr:hypothetical protein [Mesorhizobium sp.]RWJ39802.1 MAG: hypothetical protein EOR29_25215 [Mesorhizobium sp.]RWJ81345.1 MAG: hypothetical protein EOR36_24770 [Mesorhizobium sp.]TIR08856.1 MAG: hypothetical protein E5X37_17800 [Mesorhizobium sp.]